jgi:hypothetical protein
MRNKNAKSKKKKLKLRKSKKGKLTRKVIRGGVVTNPMLKNESGANATVTNQQTEKPMTKEEALAIMADIKKSLEYKLTGLWYGSNPYSGLNYEYKKNMNKYFEYSGSYDLLDKIYDKDGKATNIENEIEKDKKIIPNLCLFLYIARFFFINLGSDYEGHAGLLQGFYETIYMPKKHGRNKNMEIQSDLIIHAKELKDILQEKLKPKSSFFSMPSFLSKKKSLNQPVNKSKSLNQPVNKSKSLNQPVNKSKSLTQPVPNSNINKSNKVIIARTYVPFDELQHEKKQSQINSETQSQQADSPVASPPVASPLVASPPVASTSTNISNSNNSKPKPPPEA